MKKNLRLFLFFCVALTFQAFAQEKAITGKVIGDDGSALPGVAVTIKGTTKGTSTDAEGNFRVSVPSNARLVFSYVGYVSQEIAVGNQTSLKITLETSSETLNEVVVTTFGTAKKTSFTGSAATIGADKIGPRPITNIGQALAGVSAGVQTTVGSGQPGSAPAIRIRGFGSISSSNDPLYVVDGVPYSASIANLNNDDIETITVLKDAASTALYGARAANGVVMVTTKKGAKGKNNISVKFTKGFNSRGLQEYERVGAAEYYPLMWEANRNSFAYRATNPIALATASTNASANLAGVIGTNATTGAAYNVFNVPIAQLVGVDGKLNPNATMIYSADDLNWEKPLVRQGVRDELNINFSGSSEKSDYFLSLSYLKDKGFLIRSDYDRYTARLNVNNQIKSWFKVGTNLSTTITKSNQADGGDPSVNGNNNTAFVNPFFFSRGMAPIYPVYAFDPANPGSFLTNEDGTKRYDIGNLSALGLPNRPVYGGRHSLAETVLNQNFFRRNVLGGRGYADITFLKDFKFTTNLGVDLTNINTITYGNPIVGDAAPSGRATHIFENITSYNLSQLLNYNKSLGSHSIGVLLGHENYNETDNRLNGSRSGQILDGNVELLNFTTTTNLDSRRRDRRVEGYFSRINYDFNEKYFASFSARRDGSSKFYKDTRWGTFYSVSAAWRLDQEAFIKELTFISNLKLRGSYGQTGNDGDISRYAWQPLYTLGDNNATEAGILQSSLGNRELEWESSNAFDIALEFGLLKNRINGTIEYFDRRSSNLIFDVPLPLSAGIITQTRNIGTMFNKGVELELDIALVRSKDFSWNVNLNATKIKNQITKMPDASKEIIQGTKKLKEGQSIFDFWLREFKGVNPETGVAEYRAINYVAANSRITETGDTLTNVVSNARFHYNGSSIPLVSGAITNTFKYKGFSLSALAIYQLGGKTYDGAYASLMGAGYNNAKHVDIMNRWQKPGDITNVPRMDAGRTADFDAASDRWLIDASYLNVRTVTLAYAIPSRASKKVFLENAQVYASAENFVIVSRRKGMNVQQNFDGVTSNAFSPAKSIVLGVSFSL